ncbi:MAG: hypothetical protein WCY93_10515 [Anaerolineaceae bacterium]
MAKIFDEILLKGIRSGHMPGRTSAARKWYRDKAKSLGRLSDAEFIREDHTFRSRFHIGGMYFFHYDPKHKKTLPYYDSFPLIFPIDSGPGYILGLNFHYLPYTLRAKLMDALYEHVSNDRFDDKTRMKATYGILKSASKYKEFQPTIKKYLLSHIRSKLVYVHPTEWDISLFLNVASFNKKSQTQVWAESRKKIRR